MSISDKCPFCGCNESSPSTSTFPCGVVVWADGSITDEGGCELRTLRARVAELEAERRPRKVGPGNLPPSGQTVLARHNGQWVKGRIDDRGLWWEGTLTRIFPTHWLPMPPAPEDNQ